MPKSGVLLAASNLTLLTIQNASSVLLQHHLQSTPELRFDPFSITVLSEFLKLLLSSFTFMLQSCCGSEASLSIAELNVSTFRNALIMRNHYAASVPAVSYALATVLQGLGASNLSLMHYLVLSQLKIIAAPIISVAYHGAHVTQKGWLCIMSMTMGLIFVQLGSAVPGKPSVTGDGRSQNPMLGIGYMVAAGLLVSFAGVLVERLLKAPQTNFALRNMQFSIYGCGSALAGAFLLPGKVVSITDPPCRFCQHLHPTTWLFAGLQAVGGILVAWCVKCTNTVGKNYAQGVGFLIAITVPMLFSDHSVTFLSVAGMFLVVSAVLGSISANSGRVQGDSIDKQTYP